MEISMKRILACAALAALLAGCVDDPNGNGKIYGNTARGAAIGALGGAAVGVLAGGNDARNAAIGAAVGALAGGGVGVYMDKQEADLRRQTEGSNVTVVRNGDQIELRMPADITFAVDQSNIKPEFDATLNNVAKVLVSYPKTSIDIIGHADSDGTREHNQDLSERRANSVRSYLASQGVQPVRMIASGRGEDQPLVPNTSAANKAMNRRVQIILNPVVS
ncbi:MAG: OmpA family protein [Alphaproteobacteria bacterium]|nr:OmpA family protein [Alphaproteobacteria bacterium]